MKRIIAIILALCLVCLTGCSLGGGGNYTFSQANYPKIGGSPSAKTLIKDITATALAMDRSSVGELAEASDSTADAYKALCDGKLDIILAYEPDMQTQAYIKESGKDVEMTAVAIDALIMLCSTENPVDSLTENQLSGIYSGRIKSWSEVGGKKSDILPYQSASNSAEQELFNRTLNMGDRLKTATKELVVDSSGQLFAAASEYDNSDEAIGYSTYHDMQLTLNGLSSVYDTVKVLSVDGVSPDAETVSSGEYALCEKIYVVIKKSALSGSPERVLYDWICSEQGKEVIMRAGYGV